MCKSTRHERVYIDYIYFIVSQQSENNLDVAVDVGCGSGQSTQILSPYFDSVFGLDISKSQIDEAIKKETLKNVQYKYVQFKSCWVHVS